MANNRLYLFDPEDGSQVLIAKGFGAGWDARNLEAVADWLLDRDIGGSDAGGVTRLQLRTEYGPEPAVGGA
jgi:hypothetical protein